MSSAQLNLLPKSRSQTASVATNSQLYVRLRAAAMGLAALFALLFIYAQVIQKAEIKSTNNSINSKAAQLGKTANLNTIITVQNQLATASQLHQTKHDSSRLLAYLSQLTPSSASVASVDLDFTANTIQINGSADSANTVNAFIDSLKVAKYTIAGGNPLPAFSAVTESNFAIISNQVSYGISASFDPTLFSNNTQSADGQFTAPKLTVPNTSTRTANPGSLFGTGNS